MPKSGMLFLFMSINLTNIYAAKVRFGNMMKSPWDGSMPELELIATISLQKIPTMIHLEAEEAEKANKMNPKDRVGRITMTQMMWTYLA